MAMSSRWSIRVVGAQGPDGLVLEAGGEVLAVGVVVGLGALDDAARVAALLGLAAPGLDSSAMRSPLMSSANSKRPPRKFLVGSAPASLTMLTRTAVPKAGRAWPLTG